MNKNYVQNQSVFFFNTSLFCFRSLAVGTKTGYRLYSLSSVDNLDQIYENGKAN